MGMQLTCDNNNSGPRIRRPRFGATTDALLRTAAATAHAVRPAAEKGTTVTTTRTETVIETETGIVTVTGTVVIVTVTATVVIGIETATATERGAGGAEPRRGGGA